MNQGTRYEARVTPCTREPSALGKEPFVLRHLRWIIALGTAVVVIVAVAQRPARSEQRGERQGADGELATVLRRLVEAHSAARQTEDLDAAFQDVDLPQRQVEGMRELYAQIFKTYDLTYRVDDFKLLCRDGDVAVARITQTIKRVAGPRFRDNRRDFLQVFRKREGRWRMHDQVILETAMLAPDLQPNLQPATQPAGPTPDGPAEDGADPEEEAVVPARPVEDAGAPTGDDHTTPE